MGQVYIAAIHGHVHGDMVRCLAAFMNCCYIVRRNAITTSDIECFRHHLADFHRFRKIFITTGVRKDISLLRQHALMHYPNAIELWGSPNGTCTSQTEAKHIPAVKKPWRRSGRHNPLLQMVKTLTRMDKLSALKRVFKQRGMLVGTVAEYMTWQFAGTLPPIQPASGAFMDVFNLLDSNDHIDGNDAEPVSDPKSETEIWLAARHRMSEIYSRVCTTNLPRQRRPTPPISFYLWPSLNSQSFPSLFNNLSIDKTIQTPLIWEQLMVLLMGLFVYFIRRK